MSEETGYDTEGLEQEFEDLIKNLPPAGLPANQQEATARISDLMVYAHGVLELAASVAESYKVEFSFEFPDGTQGDYLPQSMKDDDWSQSSADCGDQVPAGWVNSSSRC